MSTVQRKLEVQLLAAARTSRDSMKLIAKQLNGYQFSDPSLQWIWENAKKSWSKGEHARFGSLEGQARAEPEEYQDAILEVLVEVWKAEPSSTIQTDIETLNGYQRNDELSKGIDRATKALIRGDLDGAASILGRSAAAGSKTNGLQIEHIIDFEDWGNELTNYGIRTGLQTYDEVTMGGPARGDMNVIFGVTGMGKSILATNFGYNAFKHNHRALHIDTENGKPECRSRYVARAKRVPTKMLSRRGLNYSEEFHEWARAQQERIHKHLRLLPIGVDMTSMEEVKAAIQEQADDGWVPDVVIFDTPDQTAWKGSMDNMGAIAMKRYETVKGWAQHFNAVFWVVTQAKQDAEGKIATNKNVAWGYDKMRLADSVITINPGLDEKGHPLPERIMGNKRSAFVSKARKSAGRFIIPLTTDFATAYIAEDLDRQVPTGDDAGAVEGEVD